MGDMELNDMNDVNGTNVKRDGVECFGEWVDKVRGCGLDGLDGLIRLRMEWLDFLGRGHSAALGAIRQTFQLSESSVAGVLADFSDQVVSSYTGVSKRWLEVAREACPGLRERMEEKR